MMHEELRLKKQQEKFNYFYAPYDHKIQLKTYMEFDSESESAKSNRIMRPFSAKRKGGRSLQYDQELTRDSSLRILETSEMRKQEHKSKWNKLAKMVLCDTKHNFRKSIFKLQQTIEIQKNRKMEADRIQNSKVYTKFPISSTGRILKMILKKAKIDKLK